MRHTFAGQPYIAKTGSWSTIDVLIRYYTGWIDSYTREQNIRLKEMFKTKSATSPDEKGGEKAG
jgi:hypothetical protein